MDGSIVDGNTSSDVIWIFVSKTELGALDRDIPIKMQYLLIKRNEYISSLKLTMTDWLGRLIDRNGENFEYVLDMKKLKIL